MQSHHSIPSTDMPSKQHGPIRSVSSIHSLHITHTKHNITCKDGRHTLFSKDRPSSLRGPSLEPFFASRYILQLTAKLATGTSPEPRPLFETPTQQHTPWLTIGPRTQAMPHPAHCSTQTISCHPSSSFSSPQARICANSATSCSLSRMDTTRNSDLRSIPAFSPAQAKSSEHSSEGASLRVRQFEQALGRFT
jgi:hypothetical protein